MLSSSSSASTTEALDEDGGEVDDNSEAIFRLLSAFDPLAKGKKGESPVPNAGAHYKRHIAVVGVA